MPVFPNPIEVPAASGTYVLILASQGRGWLSVGRLGRLRLKPGYYLYAGSALGSGGLNARLSRHFRRDKKLHWHIDYLSRRAELRAVWWTEDSAVREHQWAAALAGLPTASTSLARFGASDCACPSHLVHTIQRPSLEAFEERLRAIGEDHVSVSETLIRLSAR